MSTQAEVVVIVILLISSFPLDWLGNNIITRYFNIGRKRKSDLSILSRTTLKKIITTDWKNSKKSTEWKKVTTSTEPVIKRVFNKHMNDYRLTKRLPPLQRNVILDDIAQKWADYQAFVDQYSAHDDFEKRSTEVRKRMGAPYAIGENCAMNQGVLDPAWVAFDGLIKSEGHRKNILHFNTCGTGIAKSASNTYYFVQVFADI